jgi:cell division protein FtsB
MNRKIIFAMLPAVAFSQIASAQLLSPLMKDFSAPIIKDRTLLPGDVPFGSIVYDSSAGHFFGLSNTGVWKNLSNAGGGSGANTALSNLASTAINADLLPNNNNTINLGNTSGFQFANIAGLCGTFGNSAAKIGDCGTDKYLSINTDAQINDILIGRGAGNKSTNTVFGRSTFLANTTGEYNTAVGYQAFASAPDTYANVAIGSRAMRNMATGSSNVSIGHGTMESTTSGGYNVVIGEGASQSTQQGELNVIVGARALTASNKGSRNVVVGSHSFTSYSISTPDDSFNTVIGTETGNTIETGRYNTLVGARINGLASSTSNNIVISDGEGNQRIRVIANGNTGIGTTAPTTKLQVAGEISPSVDDTYPLGDSSLRFTEVYATNGTINTSDVRMKKEIQDSDLGLSFIEKLRPVSYRWKNGTNANLHYGLIAQETEKAIQEAKNSSKEEIIVVRSAKNGAYGLNYSELISPIIKAVQELSGDQKSVKAEVASLKAENAELKARLEKLEQAMKAK